MCGTSGIGGIQVGNDPDNDMLFVVDFNFLCQFTYADHKEGRMIELEAPFHGDDSGYKQSEKIFCLDSGEYVITISGGVKYESGRENINQLCFATNLGV